MDFIERGQYGSQDKGERPDWSLSVVLFIKSTKRQNQVKDEIVSYSAEDTSKEDVIVYAAMYQFADL